MRKLHVHYAFLLPFSLWAFLSLSLQMHFLQYDKCIPTTELYLHFNKPIEKSKFGWRNKFGRQRKEEKDFPTVIAYKHTKMANQKSKPRAMIEIGHLKGLCVRLKGERLLNLESVGLPCDFAGK